MSEKLEPLPGTSDIWEPEASQWCFLESQAREIFSRYGYRELRTPVFERTEVFVRGIGTETDVVQKEMYSFADRGGRSLTLRPEGTAGVMRAIANSGVQEGEEKRVFYMGPMFRGERPAAGRRRQFHQVGVECVGKPAAAVDAECVAMLVHYLEALGIRDGKLLLNTRGCAEDRPAMNALLRAHFAAHVGGMCPDCQRRFETNISRMLDCKCEPCQGAIAAAPDVAVAMGEASKAYFAAVRRQLDALGVAYTVDTRLVRGLDYYEHTVFEITHHGLGAQSAMAGGGRYRIGVPGLEQPIAGVGFGCGLERLLMVREFLQVPPLAPPTVDAYLVSLGEEALDATLTLAQQLRRAGLRVLAEAAPRSMKAQMRAANKAGARFALIRGGDELAKGSVVCKDLAASAQEELPVTEIASRLLAGR